MSDAEHERPPFSLAAHLGRFSRFWFRIFFGSTLVFLSLHLLYMLPAFHIPNLVRPFMGWILFTESVLFLAVGGSISVVVLVIGMMWLAFLWVVGYFAPRARRWCGDWFDTESGQCKWAFRPWVYAYLWFVLFLGHLGLDIDPYMTIPCLSGVLLLLPETRDFVRRRLWAPLADRYSRWVVGCFAFLWFVFAPDAAIRIGVVVWILILLYVSRRLSKWLCLRDRVAFAILCIPIPQLITAVLPLGIDLHGGKQITQSMAYSFCEADGRLFAAVPRCSPSEFELCQAGTIDEFDPDTMQRVAQHRFLSESFTGRLEQLLCMDDRVQVGMDITRVDGERFEQNLLEFRLDDPSVFKVHLLGESAGDGLDWDPKRNAGFYSSVTNELIRLDLETGEVDRGIASVSGVSAVAAVKYHTRRDRLYVATFYGNVVELDPETYEMTAEYPILNSWELTLDEELDRLYAVGNWGMEVIDLKSGEVIKRARIGLVGRRAAVDFRNEVIYVPSTAGGRVQAFDRRTLKRLGAIPLGSGIRLPYVTYDRRQLLATSGMAAYRWDASRLARSLRAAAW